MNISQNDMLVPTNTIASPTTACVDWYFDFQFDDDKESKTEERWKVVLTSRMRQEYEMTI